MVSATAITGTAILISGAMPACGGCLWIGSGCEVLGRDLGRATRLGLPGAAQGAARRNRIRPWFHAWIAGNHKTGSLVHGNEPVAACVDAPRSNAGNGPTDDPAPFQCGQDARDPRCDDEPGVSGREVGSAGLAAPDSVDNCADTGGGATSSVDGLARSAATAGRPVGAAGVRCPPIRRAGRTGDLAGGSLSGQVANGLSMPTRSIAAVLARASLTGRVRLPTSG